MGCEMLKEEIEAEVCEDSETNADKKEGEDAENGEEGEDGEEEEDKQEERVATPEPEPVILRKERVYNPNVIEMGDVTNNVYNELAMYMAHPKLNNLGGTEDVVACFTWFRKQVKGRILQAITYYMVIPEDVADEHIENEIYPAISEYCKAYNQIWGDDEYNLGPWKDVIENGYNGTDQPFFVAKKDEGLDQVDTIYTRLIEPLCKKYLIDFIKWGHPIGEGNPGSLVTNWSKHELEFVEKMEEPLDLLVCVNLVNVLNPNKLWMKANKKLGFIYKIMSTAKSNEKKYRGSVRLFKDPEENPEKKVIKPEVSDILGLSFKF